MKRRLFKTKELIQIYTEHNLGKGFSEIARELGTRPWSTLNAYKSLAGFISGEKQFGVNTYMAYKNAVAYLLQKQKPQTNGGGTPTLPVSDNLKRLEDAFAVFQEALVDIVIDEVNIRSAKRVSEKEQEIAVSKEKYEKELQRLQALILSMKDSSVVGMIKRKWQQQ